MPPSDSLNAAGFRLIADGLGQTHKITVYEDAPIPLSQFEIAAEEERIAIEEDNKSHRRAATLRPMTTQERQLFKEHAKMFKIIANTAPSVDEACKDLEIPDPALPRVQDTAKNPLLKQWQPTATRWLIQKFRTMGGAILADERGLGKQAELLSALAFMNNRRDSSGEFGPALPTLVIGTEPVLYWWLRAMRNVLPGYKCAIYSAKRNEPLTRARLTTINAKDRSRIIVLADYEPIMKWHGKGGENISGCFSLLIVDGINNVKDTSTPIWKAVSNIKPQYWAFVAESGPTTKNWCLHLSSILALFWPDSLWETSMIDKTLNPFELPLSDAGAVLQATPYAMKNFIGPLVDGPLRRRMLGQVYARVILKRTYTTEINGIPIGADVFTAETLIIHISPGFQSRKRLQASLSKNRKGLIPKDEKGEYIVNGRQLMDLVLAITWQPLTAMSCDPAIIQKYRADGVTLRGFLIKAFDVVGAEEMGFDPRTLAPLELLMKLCDQSPKLNALCRTCYVVFFVNKKSLIIWVEYLLEQLFVELVLRFLCLEVKSIRTGLSPAQQIGMAKAFRQTSLGPHLVVTTYRDSGASIKLHEGFHKSVEFTRSLHGLMGFHSGAYAFGQFQPTAHLNEPADKRGIEKLVVADSWDTDPLRDFIHNGYSDFYALGRKETDDITLVLGDEQADQSVGSRKRKRE